MAMSQITVRLNDLVLIPLQEYAAKHKLTVDFVLAVAINQFLDDPDNQLNFASSDMYEAAR